MTADARTGESNKRTTGFAARLGPNVAYLAMGQAASWLIRPITVLLISRQLGPVATGKLVLALSIWKIVGLAIDFGLERLLPSEIAQRPQDALAVTSSALRVVGLTTLAVALVEALLFAVVSMERSTIALYVVIGAVTVATRFGFVYVSALRGLERTAGIARSQAAGKVVELIVVIALLAASNTLEIVAIGLLVGAMVQSLVVIREFRKLLDPTTGRTVVQFPPPMSLAIKAAPLMVFGLLVVSYREIDVLVMSRLVDTEVLGWYGAADRLYGSAQFITTIAAAALYPVFAQLHASRDGQLVALLRSSFTLLFTISIAVGLGTWLTGAQLVEVLFGQPFAPGGDVLALFGIALVPAYLTVLLGTYAVAIGQHVRWAYLQVAAIAGTFLLDVFLVPVAEARYGNGALGGAWSYIIIETAILVIGVFLVAPALVTTEVVSRVGRSFVAGAAMVVATKAVAPWPLAAEIVVGALTYVVAARLLGVISMAELRRFAEARA